MVELREQLTEAGLPHKYLGLRFLAWSRTDICTVLDHYNVSYRPSPLHEIPPKFDLFGLLHDLINSRGLTRDDRFLVFKGRLPLYGPNDATSSSNRSPNPEEENRGLEPQNARLPNVNGSSSNVPLGPTNRSDGNLGECVVCYEALISVSTV